MSEQKIVLLNYLGRNGSGPINAIAAAKGFLKHGERVYALLSKGISNKDDWDRLGLYDIHYIDTYKNKWSFVINTILFRVFGIRKIKKYYENVSFSFVFMPMLHFWAEYVNNAVVAKKKVAVIHDPVPHSGEKMFVYKSQRKIALSCDEIVVHSPNQIDQIMQLYSFPRENIHYIPLCRFSSVKSIEQKKKLLSYSSGNYNFLFFGRIEKYKGVGIMIDAYKKVHADYPNTTLNIIGRGDVSDFSSKLQGVDGVTLINRFLDDSEVGTIFNGPNVITVLPYIDATQSGPLLIAYEYDSLVISADHPGLVSQLDGGSCGIIFKAGDTNGLADAMVLAITDRNLYNEKLNNARNYLSKLEPDIVYGKLIEEL